MFTYLFDFSNDTATVWGWAISVGGIEGGYIRVDDILDRGGGLSVLKRSRGGVGIRFGDIEELSPISIGVLGLLGFISFANIAIISLIFE